MIIALSDGTVTSIGDVPPAVLAMVDQAVAAGVAARRDAPQAAAEERCTAPPMGCGQPLGQPRSRAFRDEKSYQEYGITGMCQRCQDAVWDTMTEPDDIAYWRDHPDEFGRCSDCGRYVQIEHVDVGVGIISGFDCCYLANQEKGIRIERCGKINGTTCLLGLGHLYECEILTPGGEQAITQEMVDSERAEERGKPHFGDDGWCRCVCTGCAPHGCSHKSNPGDSCVVRP